MARTSRKPIPDKVLRFIESGEAEALDPQEILTWAIKKFQPQIALSCSFGAPEGIVLLDMMHRIDPASRVFVIDTGRLPQATYDLIDRVRDRYDKPVEVLFPRADDVQKMVRGKGVNLFYESIENRQLCCRIRKVEPLNRHLAGLDAWVSGLRRDQNVTRESTAKIEIDHIHGGIVKVNPIADWTRDRVMSYVRSYNLPINRLHEQGYPSVGCDPCSRAIQPGEDERAGRWWWENPETRECGIHVGEEDQGSGI
jgi:phosphoadenosine phosphosulfate reductase